MTISKNKRQKQINTYFLSFLIFEGIKPPHSRLTLLLCILILFFPNLFCSCSSIGVCCNNFSLGWFLFTLLSFCCCSSWCLYYCKAFTLILLFLLVGCEWNSLKFLSFIWILPVLDFIFEYLVLYRLNSYSQYLSLVYWYLKKKVYYT